MREIQCRRCSRQVRNTCVYVTDGPDAGGYHKACFDGMTLERSRGQWNIVVGPADELADR